MCGQAGIAGLISSEDEKIFQRMLIYNSTRGIDSTGAASVKRSLDKGEVQIVVAKEIGNPFNLINIRRQDDYDFTDVLAGTHRALLGHCRASTRGETTRFNAHPFYFDTIVGTHNGTLSFTSQQSLIGGKKFATDSEAIFNEIESVGIAETVKKFQKAEDKYSCPDAYALVWYDSKDDTLNLLRNKERPLWYAFDVKREKMYWSSEKGHLIAAMEYVPHEDKYLYELPVDTHYSFQIPSHNKTFGKPKAVARVGGRDPFTRTTTGVTGGNRKIDTSLAPAYFDPQTGFWKRWSGDRSTYLFAKSEHSFYHDSAQECWDALSDQEQLDKLNFSKTPNGIKLGWVFNQVTKVYEKVEEVDAEVVTSNPPDLRLVSSNSDVINKTLRDKMEEKLQDRLGVVASCKKVHHSQGLRAYWNKAEHKFHVFKFTSMAHAQPWSSGEYAHMPPFVPFTKLDVQANHAFHTVKVGRHKHRHYKGYRGALLSPGDFTKLMQQGCSCCNRQPEWGNEVEFIAPDLFMCEFCRLDRDNVEAYKEILNEKEKPVKQTLN